MASRLNKTIYGILGRNPVHPFPARMAPGLVFDVVARNNKHLRILDPMSGSGTVLAIAQANGHRAVGIDMDPLAVLISRVWTTPIDPAALIDEATNVLARARKAFASLQAQDAYPGGSNEETRRFVRFWFDGRARRQLASLAEEISGIADYKIRNALWCAFSRLIITKRSGASLAMDVSHSRPHKVFKRAPSLPFPNFMLAVKRVAAGCINDKISDDKPAVHVCKGDARSLFLDGNSIDLVLTSPPYLNAIDYLRCSKFSLVWMGNGIGGIRSIRSASIGAEVGRYNDDETRDIIHRAIPQSRLRPRDEAILARYVDDMRQVVRETARVLVGGGSAVYVMGENTMRGTFIPNSEILKELADIAGLHLVYKHSRELPANRRYLPLPSAHTTALGRRIRREVVLALEKV